MRGIQRRTRLAPLVCAVVAVSGYCLLVGPILVMEGPDWFVHVGRRDREPPTLRQMQDMLGRDVSGSATYGHDGREFFVLAQDPFLLAPRRDASLLDRPAYRAARIAYPAVVAPWRLFGNAGLLWGLLLTNLLVVGIGTYFTVRLSQLLRAPPWAAAFFAASPVLVVSVLLDLGDGLSLAALIACVYLFSTERFGWAMAAGVVAVLAKQPALLAVYAIAFSSPSVSRRLRLSFVAAPTVVLAAWTFYVNARLGTSGAHVAVFGPPLFGYFKVANLWIRTEGWADAVLAIALLPAAGVVVTRWWRRRSQLLTIALPFALLVPFLSQAVLYQTIDSLRAFGPAITFLGLDWAMSSRKRASDNAVPSLLEASAGFQ